MRQVYKSSFENLEDEFNTKGGGGGGNEEKRRIFKFGNRIRIFEWNANIRISEYSLTSLIVIEIWHDNKSFIRNIG